MALNLGKAVVDFLTAHPEEKFSARQIAEWLVATFPDECNAKKASSQALETDADLLQQLVAEIGSQRPRLQKKHPELKTTEGRPRKYYYSVQSDSAEVAAAESTGGTVPQQANTAPLNELSLYPKLSAYLWDRWRVYSKRIDEKTSSNKNGPKANHWLHPDVVGLEDLGADWHQAVRDCASQYFDKRTKLWSFEVKLLLNRSNVRECFFQAVSNSSWADVGYLVAEQINDEALKELRMLSAAHGIGVIRLDKEDPAESEVLLPARERAGIDWDSVNRLATENKDFLDYVKLVKQFYQTGEARLADWDVPKMDD
ncbi:HrgA protein [Accumulibacter sp.]|uniref:COG2958 family protein n=1 Tax=Accumulibacter sp. TaxID=2053492 RepID=UPI0028789F89|nr:HrgA protein [Accumulibacter sp.]MDS4015766.1 HrgA protein [Accumulibacter sp.]MDS4054658.1 HrgA protein [Accumulibacter sp.]HMW57814.1 HrgA protein [Accumulibacter sp.]